MDTSRLRTGELIAGVAGAALIIIMFLNWWGAPEITVETPLGEVTSGGGASANAWEAADFNDIVWFVTGVVAVGLALAAATAQTVALPVAASALTAGLGILSTILILYRIIDPPFDADREYGVFLGLIAAAAIAYGGWRSMQEEGTTFGAQADRLGDRLGGGGEEPPPPPPPSQPPTTGPTG
jgi:hypothetical protein